MKRKIFSVLLALIFAFSLAGMQLDRPVAAMQVLPTPMAPVIEAVVAPVTAWAHPATGWLGPGEHYTINNAAFSCGAGSDRLLVAVVTDEVNPNPGSPALASITATKGTSVNFTMAVVTGSASQHVWIGYLKESQIAGNTNSIVITNTGLMALGADVYLACYANVNQAQPLVTGGIWSAQSDTESTSSSLSLPVVNNGVIIYGNARHHGGANSVTISGAVPVMPAWTKPFELPGSSYTMTIAEKQVTADTTPVTTAFTWESQRWANAAISLNPVPAPTINISGTLSTFISEPGTPSAEQSYTVAGANLAGDITVTAPADFEISTTSGGVFGTSLTLAQSGGTVAGTTIYVRFNRDTAGISTGNIVHTSDGATNQDVAVIGKAGVTTLELQYGLDGFAGTRDTYTDDTDNGGYDIPSTPRGAETTFMQDVNPGERRSLLFFDLLSIPAGSTILSAELQFHVITPGQGFNMHRMLVHWDEAFVSYASIGNRHFQANDIDAESSLAASWTGDGVSTGHITVTVPASTIQDWVDGMLTNNGWLMIATDSEDGQQLASREYATQSDRPKLIIEYVSGGPPDQAPLEPVLVQPADEAEDVPMSPTLGVTVTDPEAEPVDVTFYGREKVAGAPSGEPFAIVVIPDSQNESEFAPEMFNAQTDWIGGQKSAMNIVFVTHVGDIVNTATDETQWIKADTAVDMLDAADVPYSVSPGNHDVGDGSFFETYFGVSRFDGKPWYGGHYGADNYNSYSLFKAAGMDFIILNLVYETTPDILTWADDLLQAYPDRRAIIVQHALLNADNTWIEPPDTFNALKDNPNLFLMLCGHHYGAAYLGGTGDDGHTIHVMMADYQNFSNGNGYLRILRFSPAEDLIYATTYSPYAKDSIITPPHTMNMDYDMESGVPFEVIGTVNGVASGENAQVPWPDLDEDTGYEWYVDVSDGSATTTGPIWSFTTLKPNEPPVISEGDSTLVTMSEDGVPILFSLTLHTTDGDGDQLEWSIPIQASHGTATLYGTASITLGTGDSNEIGYSPAADWNGSDSFVVQVDDGQGGIDTITVNVTVNPVNDAPVVSDIPDQTIVEGESFAAIQLDNYISDIDDADDQMSWCCTGHTNLTVTIVDRVATIGIPNAHWNGSETITFTTTDFPGASGCDAATFTVNRAPTTNNPTVGGIVYPVNKYTLVAVWLAMFLFIGTIAVFTIRRYRHGQR